MLWDGGCNQEEWVLRGSVVFSVTWRGGSGTVGVGYRCCFFMVIGVPSVPA